MSGAALEIAGGIDPEDLEDTLINIRLGTWTSAQIDHQIDACDKRFRTVFCGIYSPDLAEIGCVLCNQPKVWAVRLRGHFTSNQRDANTLDRDLPYFMRYVRHMRDLKVLQLSGFFIDRTWDELTCLIREGKNLRTLDLGGCIIDAKRYHWLAHTLAEHPRLTEYKMPLRPTALAAPVPETWGFMQVISHPRHVGGHFCGPMTFYGMTAKHLGQCLRKFAQNRQQQGFNRAMDIIVKACTLDEDDAIWGTLATLRFVQRLDILHCNFGSLVDTQEKRRVKADNPQ